MPEKKACPKLFRRFLADLGQINFGYCDPKDLYAWQTALQQVFWTEHRLVIQKDTLDCRVGKWCTNMLILMW